MLSETSEIQANPLCTWKELGGKIIVLQTNINPPVTHELNSTGSFIWSKLQTRIKFIDLLEEMTNEFEVSKTEARSDLIEILSTFEKKDLLCLKN
ncbi:MAG: hypothetical protein CME70_15695 [Halobacteriovorax sp.]|nr:hypothetical protein [Halobacteriovorax sp.]|tara:strand:- start:3752 stop:4036 length:285 start_codon:yes stop_codon:yes gene_type:complete